MFKAKITQGINTVYEVMRPAVPEKAHTALAGSNDVNRPFSYSEKESQSNDTLLHFVEFFECI